MNTTIQQWLITLVPLPQIPGIVQSVLPAFVLVAIMILVMGYYILECDGAARPRPAAQLYCSRNPE
jgi:hypothetical protein